MNDRLRREYAEQLKQGYLQSGFKQGFEAGYAKAKEDFERPRGEWEALGFQQGYAFCRCSNCHKTMRLYRDSKNEFCCIADIRKKIVSCMYCGADMRYDNKEGDSE